MADKVVITRSPNGRALRRCRVYDKDGNELCELPICGMSFDQAAVPNENRPGITQLQFYSFRIDVENEPTKSS